MANVAMLLGEAISKPSGLWIIILDWIEKSVVNYGWVIILFTLLIKVCLSPLDFLVKYSSKKTTLIQQKLAPQMARIRKKYGADPTQERAQMNQLYKREGFNTVGSCLIMLVNLVVTMVVFFTLFASLRDMSAYKAITQYKNLEAAYTTEYSQHIDEVKADFIESFSEKASVYGSLYELNKETNEYSLKYDNVTYEMFKAKFEDSTEKQNDAGETETVLGILDNFYGFETELTDEQAEFVSLYFHSKIDEEGNYVQISSLLVESGKKASEPASTVAGKEWKKVRDNWLWVDNLWVADSYKKPVPSYGDLKSLADSSGEKAYKNYVRNQINADLCTTVTSSVRAENNRWNGYFILAILAGVLSFLSQWITEKMSKPKDKNVNKFVEESNPQGGMMKFMKILLPALMVIFVLTSSAAFGIYILISSLMSIIISVITSAIVNACFKKRQEEVYRELEKETLKSLKKQNRG